MNNIGLKNTKISGIKKTEHDNIKLVYKSVKGDSHSIKTRKIIYGKTYFSGDIVYSFPTFSTDSRIYNYLSLIIAFADHEVESYKGLLFDGQSINFQSSGNPIKGESKFFPSNLAKPLLTVKLKYGRKNQNADALMKYLALEWTENSKMDGIAYMHVWLKFHEEVYSGFRIPNIGAVIEGKKILDIRNNNISYSCNPALCVYDYLISEIEISKDLIDMQSFIKAANICDKEITFPWSAGSVKKKSRTYEMSAVIDTAQNPIQVINNMLHAMDGCIIFDNGKWKLFAGAQIECDYSINDDDLFDNPVISYTKNHQEKVNSVKVYFIDSNNSYKPEIINIFSKSLIIEDGKKLTKNFDISFINSRDHAIYLANITLKKSRKKVTINFSAKIHAISIPINSGVKITLKKYGWNNKQFKLIRSIFKINSCVDLTFEELDNSVWDAEDIS